MLVILPPRLRMAHTQLLDRGSGSVQGSPGGQVTACGGRPGSGRLGMFTLLLLQALCRPLPLEAEPELKAEDCEEQLADGLDRRVPLVATIRTLLTAGMNTDETGQLNIRQGTLNPSLLESCLPGEILDREVHEPTLRRGHADLEGHQVGEFQDRPQRRQTRLAALAALLSRGTVGKVEAGDLPRAGVVVNAAPHRFQEDARQAPLSLLEGLRERNTGILGLMPAEISSRVDPMYVGVSRHTSSMIALETDGYAQNCFLPTSALS